MTSLCAALVIIIATTVLGTSEEEPANRPIDIGNGRDKNWAEKLVSTIKARDAIIPKLRAFQGTVNAKAIKDLVGSLDALSAELVGLDNLDLGNDVEQDSEQVNALKGQSETSLVTVWFKSENLENYYTSRGLGYILKKTKESLSASPYTLSKDQLNDICKNIPEDVGENDKFEISTDKVCKNVKVCSGKDEPRPYQDASGTNLQTICEQTTNACDVPKAVPVMTSLLWYKLSDYIALGFCSNHLKEPSISVVRDKKAEVIKMADYVNAYISSLENWVEFFNNAARDRAFSKLQLAMDLVAQREKSFKFASIACDKLGAENMCTFGNIFPYYSSLVKIKKEKQSTPMAKNLRKQARVDHVKMLELTRESLQHLEVLGNLQQLDYNAANLVDGISSYFYELAKYDQGIANQDKAFLKGKLDDFKTLSSTLSQKVERDTKDIMIAANTALAAQLAQEIAILAAQIANHLNPFKVIFTGVEVADMYEQAGEIARAAQELAHGIALFATFSTVYNDMATIAAKFQENRNQIDGLLKLVESIEQNSLKDIDVDSERFIEAYGNYTPHVSRKDLAKNDALWSAYKDSTCDLLFGAQGKPINY